MEAVGSAARIVVRQSTGLLEDAVGELSKHANAISQLAANTPDPLSWLVGGTDDDDLIDDDLNDEDSKPRPALLTVPLNALQPWGVDSGEVNEFNYYGGLQNTFGGATSSSWRGLPRDEATDDEEENARSSPPWGCDLLLNSKVYLYEGDACALEVDGLIVPSAVGYSKGSSTLLGRVLECGGRDLRTELRHLEPCRSGEARLAKAYGMNCRQLALTVGPKYKEKYRTAAQNTLTNCYREALLLLTESRQLTIAIPCVWYHHGYPVEEQAQVALRIVRRCLEKMPRLEAVVFVASTAAEAALYDSLMPAYFPRSDAESVATFSQLPDGCWHPWAEVCVEERRIPITPGIFATSCEDNDDDDRRETLFSSDDSSFLQNREDADDTAKRRLQCTMLEAEDVEDATRVFHRYLRRSRELPVESPDRRWVYTCESSSSSSRVVVVLLGARLPSLGVRDDRCLPLFIKELEPLRGRRFALLYANSNVDALDSSRLDVLQEMLTIIGARYRDELEVVVVLHPGLLFRAAFLIGRVVSDVAASAWHNSVYAESVMDLYQYNMSSEALSLPSYIRCYEAGG